MNLRTFNLNLLVVFDVMMSERSTTKAGELLGLSQSAVSNSLSQLRMFLEDPLFVRMRNEMVPTPRALELAGPISEALMQMRKSILPQEAYDPSQSTRTFCIGMTDYTAFIMLSSLISQIRAAGPNIKISVQNITADQIVTALENDGLDLCIGSPFDLNDPYVVEVLFVDDWVCARRARSDRPFTLEDYLAASHVVVGKSLSNHVDRALAKIGMARSNLVSIPFCLAAPVVIEESDLYLTLPRRLATEFSRGRNIELHDLPFKTKGFSVCSIYHSRLRHDPGLMWLREIVAASAETFPLPKVA